MNLNFKLDGFIVLGYCSQILILNFNNYKA